MQHILISLAMILILVFSDLVSLFKKKEKKVLWFAVPAYAFALIIDILVGLDVNIVSPINFIIMLIRSVFKIKM